MTSKSREQVLATVVGTKVILDLPLLRELLLGVACKEAAPAAPAPPRPKAGGRRKCETGQWWTAKKKRSGGYRSIRLGVMSVRGGKRGFFPDMIHNPNSAAYSLPKWISEKSLRGSYRPSKPPVAQATPDGHIVTCPHKP